MISFDELEKHTPSGARNRYPHNSIPTIAFNPNDYESYFPTQLIVSDNIEYNTVKNTAIYKTLDITHRIFMSIGFIIISSVLVSLPIVIFHVFHIANTIAYMKNQ